MDDRGRADVIQSSRGTSYVTTVLTKIVEGLDALEVTPDSQSLNLWRRQCSWAIGLLGVIERDRLEKIEAHNAEAKNQDAKWDPEDDGTLQEIWTLMDEWEPDENGRSKLTTFENTTVEAMDAMDSPDRRYRLYFDSYEDNCFAEDIIVHHQLMEKEKYNRICDRLSNFFARCWKVIMQSGLVNLTDQIEVPWMPDGAYNDDQIKRQVDARRLVTRTTAQRSQE